MPRPRNLAKLLQGLTDTELDAIREMVKENPEVTALKKQRAKLAEEIDAIDAKLAELTGTKVGRKKPGKTASKPIAAKPKGKPGRKPGRPAKTVAVPEAAPKRRGRKSTIKPDVITGEATPVKRGRKPMTEEQKAALRANLAKARAAKATKQDGAAVAPKVKREKKVKRMIVMNDLITSPAK